MAASATLAAGSIPSERMPRATACCRRYPSLLATSTMNESLSSPSRSAASFDESTGVLHPRIAVGRKVCVIAEDLRRGDIGRQLHEQARRADSHVKRVEGLHLIQLLGADKQLTRRRHPQIDEGLRER